LIEFGGWMFPDGESHLQGWMQKINQKIDGRLTYQFSKLHAATSYGQRFRNAVDVGGHVGLWSRYLAKRFAHVYAFEPMTTHRECFALNVDAFNVTLYPMALGEKEGSVSMHTNSTSSGDTWVDGDGDIPMHTLDSLELDDVDFIKIDTEGHELFVLRGAAATLKRCRPVIIVEQKPGHAQRFGIGEKDAIPYLQSIGYKLQQEIAGDYILTP
jgi:FkbM family methyltransferase